METGGDGSAGSGVDPAAGGDHEQTLYRWKKHYHLRLWEKLTRFLEHPELELSSNPVENSMRPVAVGRANRIHEEVRKRV